MNGRPFWVMFLMVFGFSLGRSQNSSQGWQMAPYGQIHILLVFVEFDFDSTFGKLEPLEKEGHWQWRAHEWPLWVDKLISPDPSGNGFMTQYFKEASFGKFQVTGDIVDSLFTIPISSIRDKQGKVVLQEPFASSYYKNAVLRAVNGLDSIPFRYGSSFADFDRWGGQGGSRVESPNGRLDLVMFIYRNIHVANLGNHSGFVNNGDIGEIRGMHSDMYSMFRTSDFLPAVIMRHEFSHMLYGGNNFHTAAAGVGNRTFMPSVGGWSNMSAAGSCSPTWNAWDRERLGWAAPGSPYPITVRAELEKELRPGTLDYGQPLPSNGVFVLRDFATTGDALKISLPHIPKGKLPQFLWVENHQNLPGVLDHDKLPKGVYAYVQAGKEERTGAGTFGGNNNYLWFLHAGGNYDFEYQADSNWMAQLDSKANPLTGYNYLMTHPFDLDGNGTIRLTPEGGGPKNESLFPKELMINGVWPPDSFFVYQHYPIFGTLNQPFTPDGNSALTIGSNPSTATLLTHASPGGPTPTDVRRIFLNGLSVRVLWMDEKGDAYIQIRWNEFGITQKTRWCGDILVKERVEVERGGMVFLDQGFSPQVAKVVDTLEGVPVFAEPTLLEVDSGACFSIRAGGRVLIGKGSTLIVRSGAVFEIRKAAKLEVEPGGFVFFEEGSLLQKNGKSSKFVLQPGSHVGINPFYLNRYGHLKPSNRVSK